MKKHFKALICLTLAICLLTSNLLTSSPVMAATTTTVSEETIDIWKKLQ